MHEAPGCRLVQAPLMLAMGVHPLAVAATSNAMILFTSASAAVVFIGYGSVQADYAAGAAQRVGWKQAEAGKRAFRNASAQVLPRGKLGDPQARLPARPRAALFCFSLVGTALGQLGTMWLLARLRGRSSVVVFAMAAILGLSAAMLGVQGGGAAADAFRAGRAWAWGSICGSASA